MNLARSFRPFPSILPALAPARLRVAALLAGAVLGLPCAARAQGLALDNGFAAPLFTTGVQAARVVALANGQFLVFSGYQDPFIGFDRLNGVATGNLVRFNADGSVDSTFLLDPTLRAKSITAVAPMANGQYVVGTLFVSAAASYAQVYRLNANGSVDTAFAPGPETANAALFRALAVQTDGKVLAGCTSDVVGAGGLQYDGVAFTGLLRLNTDGSVDTAFDVVLGNDGTVELPGITADGGIQLQGDGRIVVAGGFSSIDGTTQSDVARLNTDGTLDTTFVPTGFSVTNGSANFALTYPIRSAAVQTDGKIVLAGRFNRVSGTSSDQPLVRLNADGGVDRAFNAPAGDNYDGFLVRLQPDTEILLSDLSYGLLRFNTDGSLDTAFNANSGGVGFADGIAVQPGGQVLVAGDVSTSGVLRLDADGTPDTAFNIGSPQADAPPFHLAVRPDGTILASGDFNAVAGQARAGLALLHADGSLDAATLPSPFLVDAFDAPDFLLQSDGKILLFGSTPADPTTGEPGFTYLRVNADLSTDATFAADPSVPPFGAALYQGGSGYLLSAGSFDAASYIGAVGGLTGDPAFFLHRLTPGGAPDTGFAPGLDTTTIFNGGGPGNLEDSTIYVGNDNALAVQPDGKILYQYFDGTEAYRIVRFNADGSLDGSFRIGSAPPTTAASSGFTDPVDLGQGDEQALEVGASSNGISGAYVQSDGGILIYGDFATYNGGTANGLARLETDGTLDPGFSDGAGPLGAGAAANSSTGVTNVQELPNGELLVVGGFQSFDGVALPGVARLHADGSVDTTFTASGVVSRQVSIGPEGFGSGGSSLAPAGNGTYLLTGNYANADGQGGGTFFRLFGGVATTPTPVAPVVPSSLPAFFDGSVPLSGGFYYLSFANGNLFGYYDLDSYPYLYHSDLGFEYVIDAHDGSNGVYLYDFASRTFFYTSPTYPFPYLYDFTRKTVLYYFPDAARPGHYTSSPRYFYDFATRQVITK